MKKDDLKNLLLKELLEVSVAGTPIQDVLLKLATHNNAATLAGFSVCAGYLLAILQQLRSAKPMDQEELEIWCKLGHQEVAEAYQRLLGCNCHSTGDGEH